MLCPKPNGSAFLSYDCYRTLIRSLILEVEPADQRIRRAARSGQNVLKAKKNLRRQYFKNKRVSYWPWLLLNVNRKEIMGCICMPIICRDHRYCLITENDRNDYRRGIPFRRLHSDSSEVSNMRRVKSHCNLFNAKVRYVACYS